jgi:CDP-paratose 2-epimerase
VKILITGGFGFLGSNLAAHALQRGHELVVFDNLSREGSVNNLRWLKEHGPFHLIHGDIRNMNDVTRVIQEFRPEGIFHLAGQVAMTTSVVNPRMDFEVNAVGSHNLLEAVRVYAREAPVIYSSTNKVYGNLEQYTYRETETRFECIEKPHGFDETTPLDFHSPYGCSKGAADQYMLDYARIYKLKTVVFRHSSMYGGRQFATYDQGWIGWFCQKAIETRNGVRSEPFTISGTGKQVRDVLHADDVIRLYFSALEHIETIRGKVFNIGGGIQNSLSLLELFALLEELTGTSLSYVRLPARESDQRVFVADCRKAKRYLDWEPFVDKIMGIKKMITWIENGKKCQA